MAIRTAGIKASDRFRPVKEPARLRAEGPGWNLKIDKCATDTFAAMNTEADARAKANFDHRAEMIHDELGRQVKLAKGEQNYSKKGEKESANGIHFSTVSRSNLSATLSVAKSAAEVDQDRIAAGKRTVAEGDLLAVDAINNLIDRLGSELFDRVPGEKDAIKEQLAGATRLIEQGEALIEQQHHVLTANTHFVFNSPLNGCGYYDEEGTHSFVKNAVTSSMDRYSDVTTLARMMTAGEEEDRICYAGRPDTKKKFHEVTQMIFLGEMRKRDLPQDKRGVYQLRYAIDSVLSTSVGQGGEYKLLKREIEALKHFNGKTIKVEGPDGQKYRVKVDILFSNRTLHFLSECEQIDSYWFGADESSKISSPMAKLQSWMTAEQKADELNKQLLYLLKRNEQKQTLSTLEEQFCRILLYQQLDLPVLFHCRSSIDRTTMLAAIAHALDAWKRMGRAIPQYPLDLLKEEEFKELWFAFVAPGFATTAYTRNVYGFKWAPGGVQFFQNPMAMRLMPKRLMKTFNIGEMKMHPILLLFSGITALKSLFNSEMRASMSWPIFLLSILLGFTIGLVQLALVFALVTAATWFLSIPKLSALDFIGVGALASGLKAVKAMFDLVPTQVFRDDTKVFGKSFLGSKLAT